MKVSVGISNHHIHLTKEDYELLFDCELTIRNELKQPNQFASCQIVKLIGPNGEIDNVRILGPFRKYTQVEISKTDCYKLGIDAPIRNSGDLRDAKNIIIEGPLGRIERECVIIPNRHIHVNEKIRKEYGLIGINEVKIQILGEKGGVLDNVYLKDSDESFFELHLDTDDANAFLLKNNDLVMIIK